MSNRKIFDDVLRTMQERLPELLIPLVNEVFHTSYTKETEVTRLPEGYQKLVSKVVADSCSLLGKQIYHFECQSRTDGSMVLRMVEYDFMIALVDEKRRKEKRKIQFPNSCIIYLRSSKNTLKEETLDIEFSDGQTVTYKVPVLKLKDYDIDEIFEKDLLILLPYYIIKYEREFAKIAESEERTEKLVEEYRKIVLRLEEVVRNERIEIFQDLLQLIQQVMDYLLRKELVLKERMGETMGGKVLPLPSDALREAKAQGIEQGIKEGIKGLVEVCQELDVSKNDTISKIIEKFQVKKNEAILYVEEYWK